MATPKIHVEFSRFGRIPNVRPVQDLEAAFELYANEAQNYDMAFAVIRDGDFIYQIDLTRPVYKPLKVAA